MLTRKTSYRLKGQGADLRGVITHDSAREELIAAGVPHETVTRREPINRFGKLGFVPYVVFPLAEIEHWVGKGALSWDWVRVWQNSELLTWEKFLAEHAVGRLNGEPSLATA